MRRVPKIWSGNEISTFIRRSWQSALAQAIGSTLALLEADAFDPRLRTHKLKGKLDGSWACSAGYDLRIIFSFVQQEDAEAILLETLGTHDEVY